MRAILVGAKTRSSGSSKRRSGVRINLIDPSEAVATVHSGQARHFIDVGRQSSQTVYDYLLTREQVRLDLQQVFVNRKEEEDVVLAMHFPASGRMRQIKFRLQVDHDLLSQLREATHDPAARLHSLRAPNAQELRFVEQGLVEFEQLCANFIYAALPALVRCAALLAEQNLQRGSATAITHTSPSTVERDGFEEYIVNRDQGWPVLRERFRLYDVVRLPSEHARHDVAAGYLVPLTEAERNLEGWGDQYREAITAYRERRESEASATRRRPKPTDTDALFSTREGRKIRERIIEALSGLADEVFPPSTGRPLERTPEETDALVAELNNDYNERRANYIKRGVRKKRDMILDEMASDGRYGPAQEALSVAAIKKMLSRRKAHEKE